MHHSAQIVAHFTDALMQPPQVPRKQRRYECITRLHHWSVEHKSTDADQND